MAEEFKIVGRGKFFPVFEEPFVFLSFSPPVTGVDYLLKLELTLLYSSTLLLMMVFYFSSFFRSLLVLSSSASLKELTKVSFILMKT